MDSRKEKLKKETSKDEKVGSIFKIKTSMTTCIKLSKKLGGIPYTAHGAKINSPALIFDFCFYAYFRLGLPRRVRKKV